MIRQVLFTVKGRSAKVLSKIGFSSSPVRSLLPSQPRPGVARWSSEPATRLGAGRCPGRPTGSGRGLPSVRWRTDGLPSVWYCTVPDRRGRTIMRKMIIAPAFVAFAGTAQACGRLGHQPCSHPVRPPIQTQKFGQTYVTTPGQPTTAIQNVGNQSFILTPVRPPVACQHIGKQSFCY